MSNAESTEHADARNPRSVEVRVSARLENLAVVRTLIGALATSEDLDLDAVADLRLAVDEACTRLIRDHPGRHPGVGGRPTGQRVGGRRVHHLHSR